MKKYFIAFSLIYSLQSFAQKSNELLSFNVIIDSIKVIDTAKYYSDSKKIIEDFANLKAYITYEYTNPYDSIIKLESYYSFYRKMNKFIDSFVL